MSDEVEITINTDDTDEPAGGSELDAVEAAGVVAAAAAIEAEAENAELSAEVALDVAEEAIEIATETLSEVRELRAEQEEAWRAELMMKLSTIEQGIQTILSEVQHPALSEAETLAISEPPPMEPEPEAEEEQKQKRRGKLLKW